METDKAVPEDSDPGKPPKNRVSAAIMVVVGVMSAFAALGATTKQAIENWSSIVEWWKGTPCPKTNDALADMSCRMRGK